MIHRLYRHLLSFSFAQQNWNIDEPLIPYENSARYPNTFRPIALYSKTKYRIFHEERISLRKHSELLEMDQATSAATKINSNSEYLYNLCFIHFDECKCITIASHERDRTLIKMNTLPSYNSSLYKKRKN